MPTTPDSFNGTNFRTLKDGFSHQRTGAETVRHVPWGNVSVIQRGGSLPEEIQARIYVASQSDFNALRTSVDVAATLTISGGVYTSTATLRSVDVDTVLPGGQYILKAHWTGA